MKGLTFACLLCILLSCGNKNRIPSGVLPEKKMQAVLWDLMRVDQFLGDHLFRTPDTAIGKVRISTGYYQEVLRQHGITRETFRVSYDYYSAHPERMRSILDSIAVGTDPVSLPVPDTTVRRPLFDSARRLAADKNGRDTAGQRQRTASPRVE
ncbi:MAG: hypothetical protein RJA57_749 [Bacteroidota bacterium]